MQSKTKSTESYFCTECGYESKKWMGQCPGCKSWNTFSEAPKAPRATKSVGNASAYRDLKPLKLDDIRAEEENRIDTGYGEFSRVLGGGIVPGSIVLVGGDPGIGKSTLLLQTAIKIAEDGRKVLYISGEESLAQIKLRANRVGHTDKELKFLTTIDIDAIIGVISQEKPDLCIIDSIQTMYCDDVAAAAGSVSQVKECAQRMMICAKQENVAVFLVGHVTKEGTVAGPRVLEHIVDTVLYFESSEQGSYRILRSAKNRFGSTNEIGVFEMASSGLKEVLNPSEYMLDGRPDGATGAVVTCLMEGTRPMLLEVQGLVSETQFSLPRRQATGFDYNRLNLLLAVLEKRGGLKCYAFDAYVNIAGGMKITEPAMDL
ncbi:MAG: DNA repair protein RadA, partial [Eubacteriales bacterium]|nr:DNA repair protein RadA [Eubacteriales bacterium]